MRDYKQAEWKEANPDAKDKSFDRSSITASDLTTEQKNYLASYQEQADEYKKNATAQLWSSEITAMQEYLKEYGEYLEKRNAIIHLYNEKIINASSEGDKLLLGAQMREDLSELDIEANKTTASISKLFGDMTDKTVSEMREIADAAEKALNFLIAGEWDEQKGLEFGMSKETFDTLRKSPQELENIRKGIRDCRNEADAAEDTFNKIGIGLKKIFDAGNDRKKLKEGLLDIEGGLRDVLRIASFLSDTLSSLGDAFGNDTMSGIAEGINVAMDAVNSTLSGAQAGAMFGPIGAAAGAAIGLVTSLASSIAKIHDQKNEKRIQDIQIQIDALQRSYDQLGDSVEKAFSKDASKMIDQQNTLLQQQKVLIKQQIAEEEDKKNTDYGKIAEYQQQIADIDKIIAENKEKAVDAIFGEDLKSAIENFASAYADAWASGTDKAKSAKEVVKNMMRQMVSESIKAAIQSSSKMSEIRQKLQEFYADNVLSTIEQEYIYNMAENLQRYIDKRYGWADSLMQDDVERQSASRGIATASQESVDENNARLTTIQAHTASIAGNVEEITKEIREQRMISLRTVEITDDIRANTVQIIQHLQGIETNTAKLGRIDKTLSDIALKGIKMK